MVKKMERPCNIQVLLQDDNEMVHVQEWQKNVRSSVVNTCIHHSQFFMQKYLQKLN